MSIVVTDESKNKSDSCLNDTKNREIPVVSEDEKIIRKTCLETEAKLALFDYLTGIARGIDSLQAREERINRR